MISFKRQNRNVTVTQVKCRKCGHINEMQNDPPYLYNTINTRYCNACKSKEVDNERL